MDFGFDYNSYTMLKDQCRFVSKTSNDFVSENCEAKDSLRKICLFLTMFKKR